MSAQTENTVIKTNLKIEISSISNGHPWDGRSEWCRVHAIAATEQELNDFIEEQANFFFHVWIKDAGQNAAVLYKPKTASAPWFDDPKAQSH